MIHFGKDEVEVPSSKKLSKEKIIEIIKALHFCPILPSSSTKKKWSFTICPYKTLATFEEAFEIEKTKIAAVSFFSKKPSEEYFDYKELCKLLKPAQYVGQLPEEKMEDPWWQVNGFRSPVLPALNQALSELIAMCSSNNQPIVEIGSAVGYKLLPNSLQRVIKTQPSKIECALLQRQETVYQLSIDMLYQQLRSARKKVSLFTAFNVLDTLSPSLRRQSLYQLSQLQKKGDQLLILLDTNPSLDRVVEEIEQFYPEHSAFPIFPLNNQPAKLSIVLISNYLLINKPPKNELATVIQKESYKIMTGKVSKLQRFVHQTKKELDLKLIELEEFFTQQLQKELKQLEYCTKKFYHASFSIGAPPENFSNTKLDMIYKAVTDTVSIRQWSFLDKIFLNSLENKGLSLPAHFTQEFFENLKKQKKWFWEQKY